MDVQRWRTRTSDGTEWASVVREAKALLERMSCERRRRSQTSCYFFTFNISLVLSQLLLKVTSNKYASLIDSAVL